MAPRLHSLRGKLATRSGCTMTGCRVILINSILKNISRINFFATNILFGGRGGRQEGLRELPLLQDTEHTEIWE